jgi:hypothetical protein
MATSRNDRVRVIRVRKGATRKEIYAKVRKAFTADDLAECLKVHEKGIPAEKLLEELKAIHREESLKRKRRGKRT